MLFHPIGLIGVKESEPRLPSDRIAQKRPEVLIADEVDELGGISERMAVVRRQQDEGVAGRARRDGALQRFVEERRLRRVVRRLRARDVRDRVDPGPVRIDVRGSLAPRPLLEQFAKPHAHRGRQEVGREVRLGRVHSRHRLVAEDLRLDDP